MTSTDIAAWVQAIGSIIAIVASVGLVVWQNRVNDRQRRRDLMDADARQLEAAFQIVGGAAMVCQNYAAVAEDLIALPESISKFVAQLGAINDAMAAIDHTRVGGYVGIEAILTSLSISRAVVELIRGTNRKLFSKAVDEQFIRESCTDAARQIGERARKMDERIQQLKAETQ